MGASGSRQVRSETFSSRQLSASSSTEHIMRKLTGTASPEFKLRCGKRGIVQRTLYCGSSEPQRPSRLPHVISYVAFEVETSL